MKNKKGFTLIELMIVVAILSVLVAIALPQYDRFSAKTKRSEGIAILKGIHQAELAYFASEDNFQVPGGDSLKRIGFELASPAKYYLYDGTDGKPGYFSTADSWYIATLRGNLDGDALEDQLCIGYGYTLPYGMCNALGTVHVNIDDVLTN